MWIFTTDTRRVFDYMQSTVSRRHSKPIVLRGLYILLVHRHYLKGRK